MSTIVYWRIFKNIAGKTLGPKEQSKIIFYNNILNIYIYIYLYAYVYAHFKEAPDKTYFLIVLDLVVQYGSIGKSRGLP